MRTGVLGGSEILQVAESIAREKNFAVEIILSVLEEGLRAAARRKYGYDQSVKVTIDRNTGYVSIVRQLYVVNDINEPLPEDLDEEIYNMKKISLEEAQDLEEGVKLGAILAESLPPINLGRIEAGMARNVISSKVRDMECEREYEEFRDRMGEIVSGVVEKLEYGDVVVRIGRAEAVIKQDDLLSSDRLQKGDRVRGYLLDVKRDNRGRQLFLSRTHPEFLSKLFVQEVPEVYDKVIEIKAVAREPGIRSKIAVYTRDSSLDPVGSCVGIRGSRVQAISSELNGEKIEILQWSSDPAKFVVDALSPAEVSKVILNQGKKEMSIVVPDEYLSLAIGKKGQNIRLASALVGYKLNIMSESDESEKRVGQTGALVKELMEKLDIDEMLAQLLAAEGYGSVEKLASSSVEQLKNVEGMEEEVAQELIIRAKESIKA